LTTVLGVGSVAALSFNLGSTIRCALPGREPLVRICPDARRRQSGTSIDYEGRVTVQTLPTVRARSYERKNRKMAWLRVFARPITTADGKIKRVSPLSELRS
jgi:hypothetical protein